MLSSVPPRAADFGARGRCIRPGLVGRRRVAPGLLRGRQRCAVGHRDGGARLGLPAHAAGSRLGHLLQASSSARGLNHHLTVRLRHVARVHNLTSCCARQPQRRFHPLNPNFVLVGTALGTVVCLNASTGECDQRPAWRRPAHARMPIHPPHPTPLLRRHYCSWSNAPKQCWINVWHWCLVMKAIVI